MKLEELDKKMRECTACELSKTRTTVVPGEGSSQADIMFIGEGPGKNEDLKGRPFIGAAGKMLDGLLERIDLKREDVYIANVVKCRPPENRDPKPEESKTCWHWLEQQIKLIKPKIIIPLGRHSLQRFIPEAVIGEYHGKVIEKKITPFGKLTFFPCYHPAAALYNGSLRSVLEEDFKKIPGIIRGLKKEG